MNVLARPLFKISAILVLVLLISSSCKKKRAFNEEDAQDTVDARYTQAEIDEVAKDINTVMLEQSVLRGKGTGINGTLGTATTSICGAVVDTSLISTGVITISYDGKDCYGRTRTGSVKVAINDYPAKKWKHQGCILSIDYINYKLKRASDGKIIEINGRETLVNESGGSWFELWFVNAPNVVNKLTGENIKVTFDGDNNAVFNFSRRMTYTFANYIVTCKVEGLGSAEGRDQLENWGANRKNETFTSQVVSPYTWKTECGSIAPISGEIVMQISGKEHKLECSYAVDKDGNSVSGSSSPCPFGWKVTWHYKKKSKNRVFSYY